MYTCVNGSMSWNDIIINCERQTFQGKDYAIPHLLHCKDYSRKEKKISGFSFSFFFFCDTAPFISKVQLEHYLYTLLNINIHLQKTGILMTEPFHIYINSSDKKNAPLLTIRSHP